MGNLLPLRFPALLAAAFLLAGTSRAEQPPPAAVAVIAQVHRAAAARNYEKLREHMISEFTWSFGGDPSVDQALSAWKNEPGYLRQLARVTARKCVYRKDKYVECPVRAGTGFRAGFKESNGKWSMEYFVEGD